jgi:hypothetical protein
VITTTARRKRRRRSIPAANVVLAAPLWVDNTVVVWAVELAVLNGVFEA